MACFYFKYTPLTGSPLYLEDEPIHWDKVLITLKRDPDWHGVNYEYTDEAIPLEFDCLSGSAFIEEIYQSQGGDGYIGFEFGYYDGIVEIPEYQGRINLNTRKLLSTYRISAQVEQSNLHDLIKTRWSTKADLFSGNCIDGTNIHTPTPLNLSLHSKQLRNNYNKITGVEPTGGLTWSPCLGNEKHDVYFVFNTIPDSGINSNIDLTQGTELGVACDSPVTSGLFLFNLNVNGSFTFNISLSFVFNIGLMRKLISSRPKIGAWTLDCWLEVHDITGATKIQQRIGTQASGNVHNQTLVDGGLGVSVTEVLNGFQADLAIGDIVYVYAHFNLDGEGAGWKGVNAFIQTYSTNFNIIALTSTNDSQTKMLLVHEVLDQALFYITAQTNRLYSKFFGREDIGYMLTGCGAYKAILNGFLIRQAELNNPKLSYQEIMNSLNAIFCIGMGYETISGELRVRVEDRGYFYQDVEIMRIDNIGTYTEEVATDKIVNKIMVGYLKYLYQDLQFLDEFAAEHEYATPITNNDNPLDIRSSLIASGYAIEITRRSQFSDTPANSTQYDDDGFIIAVKPQNNTTPLTISFFNPPGLAYIEFTSIPIVIKIGDMITIDDPMGVNSKTVQVLNVTSTRIYFGVSFVPETNMPVTLTNQSRPYIAEANEDFTSVTGLLSPETGYNLRHSPKRNLLNWAKWLNGGLYYKSAGDKIINTLYKLNGDMTTQLQVGDSCPLGDINDDILTEKNDVILAQFQAKNYFFIPEWVTFEARVTMNDIRTIRNCMTGADTFGRNYGYITCLDQTGLFYVRSWIYEMTYNPNTESVKFLCLKKEMVPVTPEPPFVCSDYANDDFAEFEAMPDLSQDIEQCIFANFD